MSKKETPQAALTRIAKIALEAQETVNDTRAFLQWLEKEKNIPVESYYLQYTMDKWENIDKQNKHNK